MTTSLSPEARFLTLALALLASCGRDAPVHGAGPLVRLALRPDASRDDDRLVRRIEVPEDLSAWTVEAERSELVDLGGEPAQGLRLAGGESHLITIPGEFDPQAFNLVTVELAVAADVRVFCGLLGKGASVAAADLAMARQRGRSRLTFDLRTLRRHRGMFDRFVLRANGRHLEWTLISVELSHRPLDRWLPLAEDGGGLIQVGEELRRGAGLSNTMPLTARVEAPAGATLSFSYGWPRRMGAQGDGSHVLVRVRSAAGEEHTRPFPLAGTSGRSSAWKEGRLELDDLGAGPLDIVFELGTPDGQDAACALADAVVTAHDPDPPTVLLITSDTHRGDHLGAAQRGVEVRTPHLDRFAAGGILFEDCYSSSNVTIPSHASLLTGTHPRDTGVIDNQTPLGERAETLAERFRAAGWVTFAITSVKHLDHDWSGLGQGFDRMYAPEDGDTVAEAALDRLDSWLPSAAGKPLFVWLHVFDAHRPYAAPDPWNKTYYPAGKDPTDASLPDPDFPPPPWMREVRDFEWVGAQYRGEVSYLDAQLARALEVPRFARGVVAITADHGESLGQHGIYWNHVGLYPDTLHVPLLLGYPGAPEGRRVARPVRQIDVGRTLLSLAGLDDDSFPGNDLLEAPDGDVPRFAIASFGRAASVQVGRWFLVLTLARFAKNPDEAFGVFREHAVELYDLESDPRCERDLARAEPGRAGRMRALLIHWLGSAVDTGWAGETIEGEDALELLEQLGYATGGETPAGTELFDPECACERCAEFE